MVLLLLIIVVMQALMQAATLGIVIAIARSHGQVHERLKYPFHLHGPVK